MRAARHCIAVLVLVVAFAPVVAADLEDGLVSHWMLDDGEGVVATDRVGGNDGILQGDAAWVSAGYVGGAVSLDGDGDYIDCGNDDSFNITDAVTLAAWILADPDFAYPDWSGIIMRGGSPYDTFAIYYNGPNRQIGFKLTETSAEWHSVGAPGLFDNDWHHVAGTYDGQTKIIYLDAQVLLTQTVSGRIQTSEGRLLLGAGRDLNPPTHHLVGMIDDARLYDRALTADEVKLLVPPKLKARKPDPADGDVTVLVPLLQWTAGDTAMLHDVYFGTDPNLGPDDLVQSHLPMTLYYHVPGLTPGATYYWRVDEIEADMVTIHTGDVWTFVAQPLTAYLPDPADGSNEVSTDPNMTLTWRAGQNTVEHHVYFGTSFDDVNDGAAQADQGTVREATFAPGALQPLTSYYWRVDEVGPDATVQTGQVWSFTTFLAVEDFESYTDDIDAGQAIFQTWIDGVENGTGSYVGYEVAANGTFGETAIVHSGGQSMPLEYSSADPPHYSETSRTFGVPQNWTAGGADMLVLYVRGRANNSAEALYVAVEDNAGRPGLFVYPGPSVVSTSKWTRWGIPLADLGAAGANLTAVKKVIIGLGDRNAPTAGGAGLVFVDDVRLTRPESAE